MHALSCSLKDSDSPMRKDPGGVWGGVLDRIRLLIGLFLLSGAGEIQAFTSGY